jgi:hygromycin-B 4-O-kinase
MDAIARSDVSMTSGFGPFDAEGAGKYGSWRAFLTSAADPDRYDLAAVAKRVDIDRARRLLDVIGELAGSCPEVRKLVHGDFGSNNVLVDGELVTGVIDWSEALIGDPLYDVANILFWRPWLDCMERQARYFEVRRPELLQHAERLRCYQLRIGVAEIFENAMAGDYGFVSWAISRCDEIVRTGTPGRPQT